MTDNIPKKRKCMIVYKNGLSVIIKNIIGEDDLYQRVSWIQSQLNENANTLTINDNNNQSNDEINKMLKKIMLSEFWYNYVRYGCKYNNISESFYKKWDADKQKRNIKLQETPSQLQPQPQSNYAQRQMRKQKE